MRMPSRASLVLFLVSPLAAQANTVTDVGLIMATNNVGAVFGQACGAVSCTVFPGGTVGLGQTRGLTHFAAPNTPFILAIGLPGQCISFPGIANFLNMAIPMETLTIGTTSSANPTGACLQGAGRYVLTLPPNAPTPITFRVQSLGMSNSGTAAFGPAIESTLQ